MRQAPILREYDPPPGVAIASLEHDYAAGFVVPEHAHGSDQLIYAVRGVMEVTSRPSVWVIPPQFALWLPACTPHSIFMPRAVSMRTLYFRPRMVKERDACTVLHVSPLLRELIVESVRIGKLRKRDRGETALCDLVILQLQRAHAVPTFIRMPFEPRALCVAQGVVEAPGRPVAFSSLCAQAGASVRTIQRIFLREVGLDFGTWRRQVRLTKAVELLASGCSVKEAAHRVGYNQPSAFIATFRHTFGLTPKVWVGSLGRS